MKKILNYAGLVKFSHTIFALPFALIGYVYGLVSYGLIFEWLLLVKILLCMIFARNTAMGFNRWVDRMIDAKNPRTASREIPTGKISARETRWFIIINAFLFLLVTLTINPLTLFLAPVALFIIMGYSYTKRFTAWSHVVLGVSLAIAPVGAYIAVTGSIAVVPVLLAGLVITWVAGFDIIYSLQDENFDRQSGLHSVPAHFGVKKSITISVLLHMISIYAVVVIGTYSGGEIVYWIGAALFTLVLVVQHILARPSRIDKIGATFTLINGVASILYALCTIIDLLAF